MITPYTPSDEIANRYRIPTLMSASTSPASNGITAQAIRLRRKVSIGAARKITLFAPDGRMVSLASSFTPSAKGCSRPNGPTTFGPLRSCIAAMTLRSKKVRYATATSSGTTIARTCATMIAVGTTYVSRKIMLDSPCPVPAGSTVCSGGRRLPAEDEHLRALGHRRRSPADRIGHVEVLDRRRERRLDEAAAGIAERSPRRRLYGVDRRERLMPGHQRPAELGVAVERQRVADRLGQRPQDLPVLARLAEREAGGEALLHPTLGVDVEPVLFGIGGARQHDVGTVRALVAMMALIHHEGVAERRCVDLVGTEQVDRKSTRLNSCH